MKAPPEHVEPITADQLRKIIAELRCRVSDPELLNVMAAALTDMQHCNDDPKWEPTFPVRVYDELGHLVRINTVPFWLRPTFDVDARARSKSRPSKRRHRRSPDDDGIGHPRHGEKDGGDLGT